MNSAGSAWRPWGALALDAALAAAGAAWAVVLTLEITTQLPTGARLVALAAAVIHGGSVLFRRRTPRAVCAVLLITALVYRGVGLPPWFLGPGAVIGLYTVAVRTSRRTALVCLAAALAVLVAAGVGHVFPGWDSIALYATMLGGAVLLGDQVRRRQDEAALHLERARQLERAREDLARYAVAQERLRIARELHDVVAHSMSVVAVNAGAARVAVSQDPAAAAQALSTIEVTSRSALAEMRQLLGILRDGETDESLRPLPGLADLPLLVAGFADAGLTVDVTSTGDNGELPAGLGLAVYRIVQEALTNVLKHSAAGSAHVAVDRTDARVVVRITDTGPRKAATTDGGGSGLVGMRERVALYGGTLRAGGTAGGGFEVEAVLPLERGTE